MCLRSVLLGTLLLCLTGVASANPITYAVNVNTSSISGTVGSLDFNFNPGPLVTQSTSLQIIDFTADGTLAGGCPCGIGNVSGQLPAVVTFGNGSAYNDEFEDFTFGSTLSFLVSLYGPALSSPNGATSGTTFAFGMFSDAAGTMPTLTTDTTDGFAFTVNVNLDGTTIVNNLSTQTTVTPGATSITPEPSSSALVITGIFGLSWVLWRQRRKTTRFLARV